METLSPHSLEILGAYYRGRTDEDIAREFGVTHQAVNKARLNAIKALRRILLG